MDREAVVAGQRTMASCRRLERTIGLMHSVVLGMTVRARGCLISNRCLARRASLAALTSRPRSVVKGSIESSWRSWGRKMRQIIGCTTSGRFTQGKIFKEYQGSNYWTRSSRLCQHRLRMVIGRNHCSMLTSLWIITTRMYSQQCCSEPTTLKTSESWESFFKILSGLIWIWQLPTCILIDFV